MQFAIRMQQKHMQYHQVMDCSKIICYSPSGPQKFIRLQFLYKYLDWSRKHIIIIYSVGFIHCTLCSLIEGVKIFFQHHNYIYAHAIQVLFLFVFGINIIKLVRKLIEVHALVIIYLMNIVCSCVCKDIILCLLVIQYVS